MKQLVYSENSCNWSLRLRRVIVDLCKICYNQIYFTRISGYPPRIKRSPSGKAVFVISHMRSGSTLLTNLLASSDEICGYGETAVKYTFNNSDALLFDDLSRVLGVDAVIRSKYVLDKLLHNDLGFPEWCSSFSEAKYIVLIRDPSDALRSMMKMPRTRDIDDEEMRMRVYCDYLYSRLSSIDFFMSQVGVDRVIVIQYEDLIGGNESVLCQVSSFLGLSANLDGKYTVDSKTCVWGVGDASENIKSGRIMPRQKLESADINVPLKIQDVYDRIRTYAKIL